MTHLKVNDNLWQRGYLCCHPLTGVSWNNGKQRLYWYFRVLCVLNSINQSNTIPVIPLREREKRFLLVVNIPSIPCILHTLKHVEKIKLHDFKKIAYQFTWGMEISFPLNCKIYTDNCLSTFIIYCIGISVFPIVYVLGLYNYN